MRSLRRRLFLLLVAATGAIWVCAVAWIYLGSRNELEHVLDTRLQEAARMVHSLVGRSSMEPALAAGAAEDVGYARQLSCQIWSFDGRLLGRSTGAPDQSLAEEDQGFSNRVVGGDRWRVYTIVDTVKGVRVAIGDRIGLRERLVRDLVAGLVGPAVLILPLLGGLIWLGLGRGLKPLNDVAGEIAVRDADDMRPVGGPEIPTEVAPLIAALNGLFGKVESARRLERDVTAFAAHELRTPLAGMKTQAQIALAAADPAIRDQALRQMLVSVDRTGRLVRQLLALARLEAAPPSRSEIDVGIGGVLKEVTASVPAPAGVAVEIDPTLDMLVIRCDRESLHQVLRNLQENAVDHMKAPGTISWRRISGGGSGLYVEDEGPGVPPDELGMVANRFFRGRHRSATGTGLGLTIATMAAGRIGASLHIANRDDATGLRCSVTWP